ncbi:MAG: glycosyltransferase family 2 protein [Phycisphaerae bacterium]
MSANRDQDTRTFDRPGSPPVTVVVPTRDRRASLSRCLEALREQRYPDVEIIVVDDASSDETSRWLQSFAASNPRMKLRWLRNERRLGANASRNRAIREARGDYIAFLDSDCVAAPDWLEQLMAGFTHDRIAAVTGRVDSPPPSNIYELTLKGTSRVHGAGAAPRLVAGNMCIRRNLLIEHPLDEDLQYGCDEEGIFLRLRAAGYEQRLAPDAVVHHEHGHDRRSFFRQAFIGGAAAAWLVYKYHLPPRLDLLPFILAYASLPLVLVDDRLIAAPLVLFGCALAALAYNERFRKRKSVAEMVRCFPTLLLYYHVRLAGYLTESLRLRLTRHGIRRVRLRRTGSAAR